MLVRRIKFKSQDPNKKANVILKLICSLFCRSYVVHSSEWWSIISSSWSIIDIITATCGSVESADRSNLYCASNSWRNNRFVASFGLCSGVVFIFSCFRQMRWRRIYPCKTCEAVYPSLVRDEEWGIHLLKNEEKEGNIEYCLKGKWSVVAMWTLKSTTHLRMLNLIHF